MNYSGQKNDLGVFMGFLSEFFGLFFIFLVDIILRGT